MAYIGVQPTDTYLSIASQQITGTGSATYTLNYSVSNEEDVAVFVNNVRQNVSSYTVSGDQLTLGGTISASDECWVLFLGRTVGTKTPAVGSVTNDMLAGSIANAKLANSSVTVNGTSISLGGSETITAGKIGQIISSSYSTQLNVSSDGDTDTGLSASITPSSTSSKILVLAYVTAGKNGSTWITLRLKRNTGTNLILYAQSAGFTDNSNYNWLGTQTVMHLDSPNTTSATSYKVTIARNDNQGTVTAQHDGGVSTMILMEVLA